MGQQVSTQQPATVLPPTRRTFLGKVGELLLWVFAGPVAAIFFAVIAKLFGLAAIALTVVFVVIGLAAIGMLLRPTGKIGRGRAAGLIWAAFAGLTVVNAPTVGSTSQTAAVAPAAIAVPVASPATGVVTAKSTLEAKPEPVEPPTNWRYTSSKDDMRGTVTRYAILTSDNQLNFEFPYGHNTATLQVREQPSDGLNVLLHVKGQFLCHNIPDPDTISMKFDDGPIVQYGCSMASDGSADTLFIRGASGFVAKLKHASKVIIEAEYYREGRNQLTFSTGGLKW